MKSLAKSLKIFEYVVEQNGAPVTPGMIAKGMGFDAATCTRILKELTDRGYLEKISRTKGYVIGPTIYSLALRKSAYQELSAAAKQPLQELSEVIGGQVNLSINHQQGRLMLAHENPSKNWEPWRRTWFGLYDYANASNRLLLTASTEKEIDDVYQNHLESLAEWPEAAVSKEALHAEVQQLKKDGYCTFKAENSDLWILGFLVKRTGYPVAAIGYGISLDGNLEKAKEAGLKAVTAIKTNLAPKDIIF